VLTSTLQEIGNLFCENSTDLLILDSRDLADAAVADTVRRIEKLGQDQHDTYVSERLVKIQSTLMTPFREITSLYLAGLQLERNPGLSSKFCLWKMIAPSSLDCTLASQNREGDLDEFFAHKNKAYPPALSQMASLEVGTSQI